MPIKSSWSEGTGYIIALSECNTAGQYQQKIMEKACKSTVYTQTWCIINIAIFLMLALDFNTTDRLGGA